MPAGDFIILRRNDNDDGNEEFLVKVEPGEGIVKDANGRPAAVAVAQTGESPESSGFAGLPVVPFELEGEETEFEIAAEHIGKCLLYNPETPGPIDVVIPANETVSLPVGFRCEIHNATDQTVTVNITSDTLTLVPEGTTGAVEIAEHGRAILHKIGATDWVVYGFGVAAPET